MAKRLTLLDFYDPEKDVTSMSRTTAFPCTLVPHGRTGSSMNLVCTRWNVLSRRCRGNLLEGMQARGGPPGGENRLEKAITFGAVPSRAAPLHRCSHIS